MFNFKALAEKANSGSKSAKKGPQVRVSLRTLAHMDRIKASDEVAALRQAVIICTGMGDLLPKTDGVVKVKVDKEVYSINRTGKEFNFRVTSQDESTMPDFQKLFNKLAEASQKAGKDEGFGFELAK